jgi:iron(III) transport system substrate-binding protein
VLFAVPAVPKNLISQGAPINWIIPDDPYGLAILVMVTKAAPHPNAAQLFADFLLSQDGQKIWNPDGSGQASPLGFGDFDASKADLWAPAQWSKDDIAGQKATWDKRFGG